MNVIDGAGQLFHRQCRIDTRLDKVAGIEVGTDVGPGDTAQLEQQFRFVNNKAGEHFQVDANAVFPGELRFLLPEGNYFFLPPLIEQLLVFIGPR